MSDMLKRAETVSDIDALRGCEGQAAASYFESLRILFSPDWGFNARAYHPPPDPANALLSFVYTLLLKDVEAKIQLVGLDPYLGFLHALGYNRPALALDLMEEFRPSVADSVVFTMVRDRQILPQDFERTANQDLPVRMSARAVQRVVEAYEARLQDKVFHPAVNGQTDYRRAIELQVRQLARIVRGEETAYAALTMS